MHSKASFVFWLTLALYLVTLFTVTYVGVYLTYIALPLLVISGLIMKCTKPKPEVQKFYDDSKSAATQALLGTSNFLGSVNEGLNEFNRNLEIKNKVHELVTERTKAYKAKIQSLKIEKIHFEIKLNQAELGSEKRNLQDKIERIDREIELNNKHIEQIKIACELEVKAP
ncbi:hypothetical protein KKI34_07415 [Pseudoalteromonas tetraodonis]|uniref:hypothetical protein n=1 Tax=Pseudoalteromonas tetraodonis TaxID=43659 RepID=UPI001BDE5FE6|nr:hypothetical protein [Pseudoalteromonas tetraodonis]MBT2151641.1 hypothetical protein [Pseudoalteromonas tetraodonis]